jgi:hypothetical protein
MIVEILKIQEMKNNNLLYVVLQLWVKKHKNRFKIGKSQLIFSKQNA